MSYPTYNELSDGYAKHNEDAEAKQSSARIMQQVFYAADGLAKLQEMLSDLETKLEPILLPELADVIATGDVPHKQESELSRRVDDLNAVVSVLQNKVGRLANRVQL